MNSHTVAHMLWPVNRRSLLINAKYLFAGFFMSKGSAAFGSSDREEYSLADSHISEHFFAAVARKRVGSELVFWNLAREACLKVRSNGDIFSPFISRESIALFVERTHDENPLFRLLSVDLSISPPRIVSLHETHRFLGFPSMYSGSVLFVSGDYNFSAAGNPVPKRVVAILGSNGIVEYDNANFSTLGRVCWLEGSRYVGVSLNAQIDGIFKGSSSGSGSVFEIKLDATSLVARPLDLEPPLSGTLLGVDCWGDKVAAKLVEFPISGGSVTSIAICSVDDQAVLERFPLPAETEFGLPCFLPAAQGHPRVALMAISNGEGPVVWIVQTEGKTLSKLRLSSEKPKIELGTGA